MIAKLIVLLSALMLMGDLVWARYGSTSCKKNPELECYTVKRGESWEKLFPNEAERDVVMRVNRTNNRLHAKMVIAIPKNLTKNLLDFAPMPKQIDPPGKKTIMVSLGQLTFGAYSAEGTLMYWGPISGGKNYCRDVRRGCRTATGHFAIYNKGGKGCTSSKFPLGRGGAPMPYCMFFHRGFALHGSYDVPGYHASHGCVVSAPVTPTLPNQTKPA